MCDGGVARAAGDGRDGGNATVGSISDERDLRLGWPEMAVERWRALGCPELAGRVSRLDRGWSTILRSLDGSVMRVRNIGADVAVGDFVVVSDDEERVSEVLPRRSAFTRRASFEGDRAEAHTIAANIDVVMLVHALSSLPNQRRLERELVLAWDSGATPMVVLTKGDLVDAAHAEETVRVLGDVAPGVEIAVASGISGVGVEALRHHADGNRTIALLGASGVGKSTLVNALVGHSRMATGDVREGDQRGRHTTTASELIRLPGDGWLVDTPGVRAVSLWSSGRGIEFAFSDIFDLMDDCRFRDCKHESEPGCAVTSAVTSGALDPRRLESMKRLVAEEAVLEAEQRAQEKTLDRRGARRPRPVRPPRSGS